MKQERHNSNLINRYLPADYQDSFRVEISTEEAITPEEFLDMAFNQSPGWVNWLFKLRDVLVKPLGLDSGPRLIDSIQEKDANEIIFGIPDKHLTFHASLWCGKWEAGRQILEITTVVKYNNWLGRCYFFVVEPFHRILMKATLKRIAKKRGKK